MKVRFLCAAALGSILIPLAGAQMTRAQIKAQPAAPQPLAQPPQAAAPQPLAQPPQTAPQPASVAPQSPSMIPPTADLRPSTPPQVAFDNGVLTITADNSTLGDILRAVRHQTGASVDVPGNATERVVGKFGPGPARDVMASLLNGSHFNYVLLGSETNPGGLDRVVLLSKPSGEEAPAQQARGHQPAPPQPADNADSASDDDASTDMIPDASEATDEQAAPQGQAEDQPQTPGQPPIKTPEQLLQELQQRQQQLQQQGAPVPPQGYPPSPNSGTTPQQK
jgi:hypothetical protein